MSLQTILVTSPGGNIGSHLVSQLLDWPVHLVLATSDASRLRSNLPAEANKPASVTIEEGSIKNPIWLQSILVKHSVSAVFLCLIGTDELLITLNTFDTLSHVPTVKTLIYVSICGDFVSRSAVETLSRTHSAYHVLCKIVAEQKLAFTPFPFHTTVLGPSLFHSNDIRSKVSLLEKGIFDEPHGPKGSSRIAAADIALAARNAILNPSEWAGKKVMLGSLHQFSGRETAELWSQALGREIQMCDADEASMDVFEKQFGGTNVGSGEDYIVAAWKRDIRLMYDSFVAEGFGMSAEEYALQVKLLGKEPEDYREWVLKTGRKWREEVSA